MGSEAIGLCGD